MHNMACPNQIHRCTTNCIPRQNRTINHFATTKGWVYTSYRHSTMDSRNRKNCYNCILFIIGAPVVSYPLPAYELS